MTASAPILSPESEMWLRLGCFAGVLLACLLAEWLWPRRRERRSWSRLTTNLALVIVNSLLLRLLLPVLAVGMAVIASERGWGLFNLFSLPLWLELALAVLLLDLAIYWQHRLFHLQPLFWRLHRVHHCDLQIDTTTGLRFHPLEILISMGIKFAVVIALGAAPLAVLVFEVLLNAGSLFNHANLAIPQPVDRWLRWLVVTPDMHRVHHSWHRQETDSNFSFCFPWWDHLFGSYQAQPADGHSDMTIGLHGFRDAREQRLDRLLLQPVRRGSDCV